MFGIPMFGIQAPMQLQFTQKAQKNVNIFLKICEKILRFLISYSSFSVKAILALGQLAEKKLNLKNQFFLPGKFPCFYYTKTKQAYAVYFNKLSGAVKTAEKVF